MSLKNEHLGEEGKRGGIDKLRGLLNSRTIHYGKVVEVSNDGSKRIKVSIDGIDNKKKNSELKWCHSLLPLHLNVVPEVGNLVTVILMNSDNPENERTWLGPVVSSLQKIGGQDYLLAKSGREGGLGKLGVSIDTLPEADGVFPGLNDIALIGKVNSDVILKENEVLIRAGKHDLNNVLKLNKKNPSYLNLRVLKPSDINKPVENDKTKKSLNISEDRTDAVLMANKIFLIGRDSNSKIVKPILDKEDHIQLEEDSHPMVHGDVLAEFILRFQIWMKTHIHEGSRLKPDYANTTEQLDRWISENINKMLSKNVYLGGENREL